MPILWAMFSALSYLQSGDVLLSCQAELWPDERVAAIWDQQIMRIQALFLLNPIQMRIRAQKDRAINHRWSCQCSAVQFIHGE